MTIGPRLLVAPVGRKGNGQLQRNQLVRIRNAGERRSTMPFISLSAQVAMQMPRLSEISATAVKPGEALRVRSAKRRSCRRSSRQLASLRRARSNIGRSTYIPRMIGCQ